MFHLGSGGSTLFALCRETSELAFVEHGTHETSIVIAPLDTLTQRAVIKVRPYLAPGPCVTHACGTHE